jgi:hypothetical protein
MFQVPSGSLLSVYNMYHYPYIIQQHANDETNANPQMKCYRSCRSPGFATPSPSTIPSRIIPTVNAHTMGGWGFIIYEQYHQD